MHFLVVIVAVGLENFLIAFLCVFPHSVGLVGLVDSVQAELTQGILKKLQTKHINTVMLLFTTTAKLKYFYTLPHANIGECN